MTLEQLFGEVLEVDPASLNDNSQRDVLVNWDSLGHINLISALEEIYSVSLNATEINHIKTLGDARAILRTKGVRV